MTTAPTLGKNPFAKAVVAWMEREKIPTLKAAAILDVSPGKLIGWVTSAFEPSREEITRVLERIAGE